MIRPLLLTVVLVSASQFACKTGPAKLTSEEQKYSYSLGQELGNNFKTSKTPVDVKAFMQGFEDKLTDAKPAISPQLQDSIRKTYTEKMRSKMSDDQRVIAEKNKKIGDAFLAENTKIPGVITTASGLQYQIVTEGSGAFPRLTDTVTLEYTGKLLDGKEFDSSAKHGGKPAKFTLNTLIPGWTEALQLMKAGGSYKVWMPPTLAYGERGAGNIIAPNQVLIFDVKLLTINK